MTKRTSVATAFNPVTGVVDTSGIAGFIPSLTLAIINTSSANRATMYDFVTPGLGFISISGSLLTLEYDTEGMSSSDNILIFWDDGQSVQGALSPPLIAAGLAALEPSQLAAMAQAVFAAIANVQQGGSIPSPGGIFINSDGFVVVSQ